MGAGQLIRRAGAALRGVLAWLVICSLVASMVLPSAAAAKTLVEPDQLNDQISSYLTLHQTDPAGVAVIALSEGSTLFELYRGFEDARADRRISADTIFEWGGLSDLLVWASALQLEEQGKLELDRDIKTYLPNDMTLPLTFDRVITFRDLMTGKAGFDMAATDRVTTLLPQGNNAASFSYRPVREILDRAQADQIYLPGDLVVFDEYAVTLAAYIIEQVSGVPYDEYVQKNIFERLNMYHTVVSEGMPADRANQSKPSSDLVYERQLARATLVTQGRDGVIGYDPEGVRLTQTRVLFRHYPAHGCVGTIVDLAHFLRALSGNGYDLLFHNQATIDKLFVKEIDETHDSYYSHGFRAVDFGLATNDEPVWYKQASTLAMGASVTYSPVDDLMLVVMTNSHQNHQVIEGIPELVFGSASLEADQTEPEIDPAHWEGRYQLTTVPHHGLGAILSFLHRVNITSKDGDLWYDGRKLVRVAPQVYRDPAQYAPEATLVFRDHPRYGKVLSHGGYDAPFVPASQEFSEQCLMVLSIFAAIYSLIALVLTPIIRLIRIKRAKERFERIFDDPRSTLFSLSASPQMHRSEKLGEPMSLDALEEAMSSQKSLQHAQGMRAHLRMRVTDQLTYLSYFLIVAAVSLTVYITILLDTMTATTQALSLFMLLLKFALGALAIIGALLLVRVVQAMKSKAIARKRPLQVLRMMALTNILIVLGAICYWEFVL